MEKTEINMARNVDTKNNKRTLLTPCRRIGLNRKSFGSTPPMSSYPKTSCQSENEHQLNELDVKLEIEKYTPKKIVPNFLESRCYSRNKKFKKSTSCHISPANEDKNSNISNVLISNMSNINNDDTSLPKDIDFETKRIQQQIFQKLNEVKCLESELINVKQVSYLFKLN